MRIKSTIKAFTLIELLVVITIIGILATGATAVYTSQIQKARDTTRINDQKALQSAIEQIYQDNSEYPLATQLLQWTAWITWILTYLETVPSDPKHGQPCNDWWVAGQATDCAYMYVSGPDNNSINYGEYELSTAFEAEWNVDKKAALDNWGWDAANIHLSRFEIWLDISNNDTSVAVNWITVADGNCTPAWAAAAAGTDLITLNWNPTTAWNECN